MNFLNVSYIISASAMLAAVSALAQSPPAQPRHMNVPTVTQPFGGGARQQVRDGNSVSMFEPAGGAKKQPTQSFAHEAPPENLKHY